MMKQNLIFLAGALAGLSALGCGGGGTPDGGTDSGPGNDLGPLVDSGPTVVHVQDTIFYIDPDTGDHTLLPAVTAGRTGTTLMTSCVNTMQVPPETTMVSTITAMAKDFQSGDPVPMVMNNFYMGNAIPFDHSCTNPMFPCVASTTDAAGMTTAMDHQNSWYAYYMSARMGIDMAHTQVPTAEFNEPADPTGLTLNSVSAQTLAIIPTILGLARVAGTAIVAGTVYDCSDNPVQGLVIRIFQPDGTLIQEPPDGTPGSARMPGYRYFNGLAASPDLPSATQPYTNTDGLYAAANMPAPTDGRLRIEAWENAGGTPKLWGCEEINVFADGVTIINVRPFRTDGPTNCSTPTPTTLP